MLLASQRLLLHFDRSFVRSSALLRRANIERTRDDDDVYGAE